MNYNGCAQCKVKSFLKEVDVKRDEDEDGEETIAYKRNSGTFLKDAN